MQLPGRLLIYTLPEQGGEHASINGSIKPTEKLPLTVECNLLVLTAQVPGWASA